MWDIVTASTDWLANHGGQLVFALVGGAISGTAGLFVGIRLFLRQRKETQRGVAAALIAELNQIHAVLDQSVTAGATAASLANLRLLQDRTYVFRAVLPQIGILGPDNANAAVNLFFGLELIVRDVAGILGSDPSGALVLRQRYRSAAEMCLKHAKELRTEVDKLSSVLGSLL